MSNPASNELRQAWVFALVLGWKVALLALASLPVPSNDSFFYDGPVVNLLRNGVYANPAIAQALPISGSQVFSAYPPLYQWVLLPWMCVFGTSALSAMVFHLGLFSIYSLIVLAILRRLSRLAGKDEVPGTPSAWPFHTAAMFLLTITFHDRPDSLAHVFGVGGVYALLRFVQTPSQPGCCAGPWAWVFAACMTLAVCTGLQIGALYFGAVWVGVAWVCFWKRAPFPWLPMVSLVAIPLLLAGFVIWRFPLCFEGFLEHARQTPAITGVRVPRFDELLKIGRAAPGILAVAAGILWLLTRRSLGRSAETSSLVALGNSGNPVAVVLIACTVPAVGLLGAAMFFMTANAGSFTMYLQPVIVGAFLLLLPSLLPERESKLCGFLFIALAMFASIRAAGMSTWGLACARDCSQTTALTKVRSELGQGTQNMTAVLSSAYLYEAAGVKTIRWIHCDWLQKPGPDQEVSDWQGLLRLRPQKLLLTQFDYFRRYEPLLKRLASHPELARCAIENMAKIPTPDSMPRLRRVLQHISWAPVVVTIVWETPANER